MAQPVSLVAAGDLILVHACLQRFIEEVAALGFPEKAARTMLGAQAQHLVAVHLAPSAAFEQTPGG
jgi:hypothetical protein